MDDCVRALIASKYREVLGADFRPDFDSFVDVGEGPSSGAALGYRRAGDEPLVLERYLDVPVEQAVAAKFGRPVARRAIVEIGNFAAENAMAMITLWGRAANDLGAASEVAVATLTAPHRSMFARIGIPFLVLAPAPAACLGAQASSWGRYYDLDPQVCAGIIADGQAAIAAFLDRRRAREAA